MRSTALLLALVTAGCSSSAPPASKVCDYVSLPQPLLVLEHGDQGTSALGLLSGGCFDETAGDPVLGQDQMLLDADGEPFVGVNTDGSLRAVDAEKLSVTSTTEVYPDQHVPPGTTPAPHSIYGVAVDAAGDTWVSRDDLSSLAIFKPGGALVTTIDLAGLDPMFHNPRMNGILIEGQTAFVALGFLSTPFPQGDADKAWQAGGIARVDTGTHEVGAMIKLMGHNPVRKLIPIDDTGQTVIVATPGEHDAIAAEDGIERVDLAAGKTTQLVSETELGGSVDEVVWGGENEVYAIVLGPEAGLNPTRVLAIDPSRPAGHRVVGTLAEAPWFKDKVNGQAYVHTGLALDGPYVLVGDQTNGRTRIHVFSRTTGAEVLPAIPTANGAPTALLAIDP